jgi:hypothetical protein
MTVPGKPGLVHLKSYSSPGLPLGERDGLGGARWRRWRRRACPAGRGCAFGGEAVGHVAGGGEPARGIEQVADGFLDGGELEAFDRAVFVAGDDAVVDEGPVGRLAGNEGRAGGNADGAVGGALAFEQFAGIVGDFGDFERGMKAEVDHVEVGGRGKGDLGGGREVVRSGIELGVNDVAGDVERGAGDLRGGGKGDGREGGGEGAAARVAKAAGRGLEIFQVRFIRSLIVLPPVNSWLRRVGLIRG